MSGASDKKIIAANKQILKNLLIGEVVSTVPILTLLAFQRYTLLSLVYLFVELLAILLLYKFSKAKIVDSRAVPCANLGDKGVIGLLFDLVYLCWIGKLVVIFFRWSILFTLVMFGACVYYEIVGRHRKT